MLAGAGASSIALEASLPDALAAVRLCITAGTAKAGPLTFQYSREAATLTQVVSRQRDVVGHCPASPQQDYGCDYCCWMSHPAKSH